MYILRGDTILYLWSNLGNVSLEATCIYLAYKKRHQIARALAVFAFPTLITYKILVF